MAHVVAGLLTEPCCVVAGLLTEPRCSTVGLHETGSRIEQRPTHAPMRRPAVKCPWLGQETGHNDIRASDGLLRSSGMVATRETATDTPTRSASEGVPRVTRVSQTAGQ